MDIDRLDTAVAAIAAKQYGAFSRAQAMEAGATRAAIRWRLGTGRWERLSRDVFRIAGTPDSWHSRLWAAILDAGPGAVASHRSAAALLGIPGFEAGAVEVLRRTGGHHRVSLGRLHETFWLPPSQTRVLHGVPSTSLARTLCDLAAGENPARVARATDTSLRRLGLTIPELTVVHASIARRGRAGTVLMRDVIRQRAGKDYVPTESELEDLFLEVLRARQVPLPERQVNVGDQHHWIGRVDFLDRHANLVTEVYGRAYHTGFQEVEDDFVRASELAASGRRLMVVTYRQLVDDPGGVADRRRRALEVVPV